MNTSRVPCTDTLRRLKTAASLDWQDTMTVVVDCTHIADEISQNMQIKCILFFSQPEEHLRNAHYNTPQSVMYPWRLCSAQQNSSSTGTAVPPPWSQAKLRWPLLHGQVHQSPHRLHHLLCLQLQVIRSTYSLNFCWSQLWLCAKSKSVLRMGRDKPLTLNCALAPRISQNT